MFERISLKNAVSVRLLILLFLEYAVWGAYLTSIGRYLALVGLGSQIKWFFALNGIVSLFMPALMGAVADRYLPIHKTLSLCHFISGVSMIIAGTYCLRTDIVEFGPLYAIYGVAVLFFLPTIALSNSVSYSLLVQGGKNPVEAFPPLRAFGTVGFISSMLAVNFIKVDGVALQNSPNQLVLSGILSIILCLYVLSLPCCGNIAKERRKTTLKELFNLNSFVMFKERRMAVFLLFSILLGAALQITNGYANMFLGSFASNPHYANTFAVENSNALLSISQVSEALCILFIPFFMKRLGIKGVILISMLAWVLRFGLFAVGTPQMPGVLLYVLSCIMYGFAFDFFNVAGSIYLDQHVDRSDRSSAQGVFMMMTSGVGSVVGMICAGAVVENLVLNASEPDWSAAWLVFAGYMLIVTILFAIFFKKD